MVGPEFKPRFGRCKSYVFKPLLYIISELIFSQLLLDNINIYPEPYVTYSNLAN